MFPSYLSYPGQRARASLRQDQSSGALGWSRRRTVFSIGPNLRIITYFAIYLLFRGLFAIVTAKVVLGSMRPLGVTSGLVVQAFDALAESELIPEAFFDKIVNETR